MNRLARFALLAPCVATLAARSQAQGSDSCGAPQPISGLATFSFATGTTGSEGQSNPLCNLFGTSGIERDVWFTWTAPSTASFLVSTCNGTNLDSKIAIYDGNGCPTAPAISCQDDSCGVQTTTAFNGVAGNAYTIQLGVYPGSGGGAGTFTIDVNTTTCPSAVGPDVIVGDIQGISNYTSSGTVEALSLGTYSCNIGTQDLLWIANNNQHPVIGGALFRYKLVDGAGRFEQVGMSWLKHGFLALTDNLCCTCTGPSGSVLSVGCADPYTAARNGSQSGLGPRWQVNAHTGAFTYPPASPSFAGTTARRLEVETADLEVTSGSTTRYFGEAMYVTPDDAAAGNQNNNASHREITVAGSGSAWTFGLSGPTRRTQPAIEAWATIEPTVTLTHVQVPGDGLFVIGSKATDIGGGQWRYEYAVYNMNSDRSGGSFSVPISGITALANVGFHDVAYRNGDGPTNVNFSGADWVSVGASGSITWATETEATNASANAIRWSSLYNFRFDVAVAPRLGNVTLGLWKAGSPGSVAATAQVPGDGTAVSAYCFGDASGVGCPCGNNGTTGNGCASSVNASGATLASTGTPSIGADTFALVGTGMPNSSALYFQGSTWTAGGLGSNFGDGLRCSGGSIIRLGVKVNASGSSQYPGAGDAAISIQGAIAPGSLRTYQCWYLDTGSFCTPGTFNLTQALQATWAP